MQLQKFREETSLYKEATCQIYLMQNVVLWIYQGMFLQGCDVVVIFLYCQQMENLVEIFD